MKVVMPLIGHAIYPHGTPSGDAPPPVEEAKTISPGHGSGVFEITEIGGVLISKFNTIMVSWTGITQTGGTGGNAVALQTSTDGGATWREGASDYWTGRYVAGWVDQSTNSVALMGNSLNLAEGCAVIHNVNGEGPFSLMSADMFATAGDEVPINSASFSRTAEEVNAFRFILVGTGVPVFTGGIIDLGGFR
jgi:hypothetical protein